MMLLRVYVVPGGARSQQAVDAALALQREQSGHLMVEVVDVIRSPEVAKRDGVFTYPATMLFSLGEAATAVVELTDVGSVPAETGRARPAARTAGVSRAG